MKRLLLPLLISMTLAAPPSVLTMMQKLDDLQEMKSDITAKVNMTQQKVNQSPKAMTMVYYRRDADDAFLILMTDPEVEKGNGYLKTGDNFWMYRRNTRTFQHVNRDESIGGSDASADDFEKRKLLDLYRPESDSKGNDIVSEEQLGDIPVYKFKLIGKVKDVKYPTVVYWVRKDNFLPLKEQSYALSGTLMESAYFLKYTTINGRYVWVKGLFIDEFEKGNKSLVEISGISTTRIDDSIFTKSFLENISK